MTPLEEKLAQALRDLLGVDWAKTRVARWQRAKDALFEVEEQEKREAEAFRSALRGENPLNSNACYGRDAPPPSAESKEEPRACGECGNLGGGHDLTCSAANPQPAPCEHRFTRRLDGGSYCVHCGTKEKSALR